ncbi:hypothetical protein [Pseudoponticoccus marisrubri]|uniref:Uncharacterized protein n=1 Tax=Pseudoponticoccus marisrubri TaxID=1685382 RepID=A0A0W7WJ76_9RHOB|nr:hypothetical protein [Pseudoponticoccus marisrubri]KUF10618.1 hypothetical protein AVJ23_12150 [Pseudoponticoccus marisrubri]
MDIDLLAPVPRPPADMLAAWRRAAQSGDGSPWLRAGQADALARYGLAFGEGVAMMEACAPAFREPPRDIGWEILGADEAGRNWADHTDPQRAYALFRAKLDRARHDRVVLHYKLWLKPGGS